MSQSSGLIHCAKDKFNWYCYDLCLEQILSIIIVVITITQLSKRLHQYPNIKKRKNTIYYLIISSLTSFIIYSIDQQILVIFYFFQLYTQYLFLIYIVYYFARKTIKLRTFQTQQMFQITIYCYALFVFFTFFLCWNIIDYATEVNKHDYVLCQKQIFHIMRLIGFVIDLVLVIIAHILHKLITQKLTDNSEIALNLGNLEVYIKKVHDRRMKFWYHQITIRKMVFVTFFGQLLYFIEDVYFLAKSETKQCDLVNNYLDDASSTWIYVMALLFFIFAFQMPYIITEYMFWFNPSTKSEQQSVSVEIEAENTYGFKTFGTQRNRLSPPVA